MHDEMRNLSTMLGTAKPKQHDVMGDMEPAISLKKATGELQSEIQESHLSIGQMQQQLKSSQEHIEFLIRQRSDLLNNRAFQQKNYESLLRLLGGWNFNVNLFYFYFIKF